MFKLIPKRLASQVFKERLTPHVHMFLQHVHLEYVKLVSYDNGRADFETLVLSTT